MNTILVDSREQPLDRARVIEQIESCGYSTIVSKLPFGDYRIVGNDFLVVDRKKTLLEVIQNVGREHERIVNEIKLAESVGAKIVFLVEHSSNITCLEDLKSWENPMIKKNPKAMTGDKLYKILDTMVINYDIDFIFCTKNDTGKMIVSILEDGYIEGVKTSLEKVKEMIKNET